MSPLPPESPRLVDVCIVGSGPAGLTLAGELSATPLAVRVLERGGRRLDMARRGHNAVEVVGHPLGPPDRIRRFGVGGAGWIWPGITPELHRIDFEQVPWIDRSGWALSYDDLSGFYMRARRRLGLPTPDPACTRRFRPIWTLRRHIERDFDSVVGRLWGRVSKRRLRG